MKIKYFAMIAIIFLLTFCFCACDDEGSAVTVVPNNGSGTQTPTATTDAKAPVEYTIKVVDFDGNPVADAMVQLCLGDQCKASAVTNDRGIATFKYEADTYKVSVTNIPENMEAPNALLNTVTADEPELTIELSRKVYTYTVTVYDDRGEPVSGVAVTLRGENTIKGMTVDGKFTLTGTSEIYDKVLLSDLPAGYEAEDAYVFSQDSTELTIVLQYVDTERTYTITVLDPNGSPVKDVWVQMCFGEICRVPIATDDQGVATMNCIIEDYEVKLNNIPAGLMAEEYYTFETGSYDLTITLKKAG